MNTLTLVREVNSLTAYMASTSAADIYAAHREEDGYVDYNGAEIDVDHVEYSAALLLAEATNPTLPCLSRLLETAKEQGYNVDQQAAH